MSREFQFQMSLLLNLILLVALGALVLHKTKRSPALPVHAVASETLPAETPVTIVQPTLPRYSGSASQADRQRWLVDQLRTAGVPNDVVARIALAEIDAGWQKRFDEAEIENRGNPDDLVALHLEQEKDTEAEMRAALGEAGFKQWDESRMLREANIGKVELTAAEAATIYDLKKKLQQRNRDLEQARVDGAMDDAEINDATDKAYSEFTQQMKTVLGDERYAKSQGLGNDAANLRQDLATVNPSDAQLQDLLRAQQQLEDRQTELDKQYRDDPSSPDYAAKIKALDEERSQEFQRVLGTNVFDILQKSQDIGYSKMKKYENIWGLDDSKIDYVYGTLRYYEKSVQDYQAEAKALESQGQSVDWAAAKKNLQEFAQQTQQSLQTYLGADSFNKMERNGLFQFNQTSAQSGQIQ